MIPQRRQVRPPGINNSISSSRDSRSSSSSPTPFCFPPLASRRKLPTIFIVYYYHSC